MKNLIIRKAKKKDLPSVLTLIRELAEYEKAPNEVKVTLQELERDGFGKEKVYDCFVAELKTNNKVQSAADGKNPNPDNYPSAANRVPPKALAEAQGLPTAQRDQIQTPYSIVGIALYYIKYSTWKGRCIYLDDIIVTQSMRGNGIGKKLFNEVIVAAKKIKARKLEWQVLNWNEPAIDFYKKYSTVFDDEWINCKLVFE